MPTKTTIRYFWAIVDWKAIPDYLKTVDMRGVDEAVQTEKGRARIPGIREWTELTTVEIEE
jgi:hypothetical protein